MSKNMNMDPPSVNEDGVDLVEDRYFTEEEEFYREFSNEWTDDEEEVEKIVPVLQDPEDLTNQIMNEPDWRKRASMAAKIISQSYE